MGMGRVGHATFPRAQAILRLDDGSGEIDSDAIVHFARDWALQRTEAAHDRARADAAEESTRQMTMRLGWAVAAILALASCFLVQTIITNRSAPARSIRAASTTRLRRGPAPGFGVCCSKVSKLARS